ncbi:MAG: HEAT repeat domain-containing protein, partial [Planctomycetota bacterium]|nr:HEAT repeat domain-containing protein [Planctomycetota bacterium]
SSIPFLLKALDMESGLARAGIVWALGKLKAREALPVLARLYVDARNDESRRAGAGLRMSQSGAAIRNQYNALSSLDAVAGDWDELKASLKPRPSNPADDEPLLKPQDILDAVGEIGPAAAQDFYRTLAGDTDAEVRGEAARNLAAGDPQDLDKNLPLLRCLLADAATSVSIPAAVSLLILDQEVARQPILAWLESANPWQKNHLIHELGRVTNREQLTFARKAIGACAEDPTLDEYLRKAARKLLDSNLATPEKTP